MNSVVKKKVTPLNLKQKYHSEFYVRGCGYIHV